MDDATHTKRVDAAVTVTCDDCGETVSEKTEQGTLATEAHAYKDGVCTACGHACAHADTTETREELPAVYESVDDATHTKRVDAAVTVTCDDCGETVSEEDRAGNARDRGARI